MAFKLGCSQATDSPCKAAALCGNCCWPPRQDRRPWPSPWVGHHTPMGAAVTHHVLSLLTFGRLMSPAMFSEPIEVPGACSAPWLSSSSVPCSSPCFEHRSPGCLSCFCSPAYFKPWPQFLPALLLISSSQQRTPGTSEFSRKNRCKLLPINLLYDVITRMIKPSKQLSVAEHKYTLQQPRHRARDSRWPTSLFFSHFYRCCLPHPQDAFTSKRCHMI